MILSIGALAGSRFSVAAFGTPKPENNQPITSRFYSAAQSAANIAENYGKPVGGIITGLLLTAVSAVCGVLASFGAAILPDGMAESGTKVFAVLAALLGIGGLVQAGNSYSKLKAVRKETETISGSTLNVASLGRGQLASQIKSREAFVNGDNYNRLLNYEPTDELKTEIRNRLNDYLTIFRSPEYINAVNENVISDLRLFADISNSGTSVPIEDVREEMAIYLGNLVASSAKPPAELIPADGVESTSNIFRHKWLPAEFLAIYNAGKTYNSNFACDDSVKELLEVNKQREGWLADLASVPDANKDESKQYLKAYERTNNTLQTLNAAITFIENNAGNNDPAVRRQYAVIKSALISSFGWTPKNDADFNTLLLNLKNGISTQNGAIQGVQAKIQQLAELAIDSKIVAEKNPYLKVPLSLGKLPADGLFFFDGV